MSTGTSTANSYACGVGRRARAISYRFSEGTIVYSVARAMKGVMEEVVIKTVKLAYGAKTQGAVIILYLDTLNALWNEGDLCTEEEAQVLAIEYLENLAAAAETALSQCK